MSLSDFQQTDGQTERVNCDFEDVLRSAYVETPRRGSAMLPLVEFALKIVMHVSTGYTLFYMNELVHPRAPLTPLSYGAGFGDGGIAERLANVNLLTVRKEVDDFLFTKLSVLRHVRDAMAESQGMQKECADGRSRRNVENFENRDLVLLNAKILPTHAVSAVAKTKLLLWFIEPFEVVAKQGLAYTLNLPRRMRTHPVLYVGSLKPNRDPAQVNAEALVPGRRPTALGHPEAEPATGFEHEVQ
ncbi:FOG: Transposon-encoded proteins with TYA, reverse transcriptase, integrase domains in various combinations [Plasmopara halstedii]|uniref:FOG: Transposon-encoded proteins with TYA, reverse transcriptase, integrase domains in various combinations n=1 Tax=Plasmopara halstedii TaxID=4781 RepID=A0A0P1AJY3_PLAHL|nr:FOG: Transposon-encoded proteins with TYA, reverse transcriptase, integrase domains in various combinations [Plasmopara halstedii]CEG41543.1 FOG: Transposon-encoded proteins with TYA, reverse transcriptase, integrase domains in various combinations [Plasmopara halstedii]|eukprot:XP_024577912.1 FOG: Transposon-encoded proteins with TYA, reverse transcriptase, integrase domains in various combinations [Plasmopara halstedii]